MILPIGDIQNCDGQNAVSDRVPEKDRGKKAVRSVIAKEPANQLILCPDRRQEKDGHLQDKKADALEPFLQWRQVGTVVIGRSV